MPELNWLDDPAPVKLRWVDPVDEDESARTTWAGRPTTMAAIERAAEKNKTTIADTFANRFQYHLVQNVPGGGGQLALRAFEGLKGVGESIGASLARATGREDIASRIHQDRRNREEFLRFIEKGGDVESVLGERGSRILNQTVQSIGGTGTAAVLAGPVGAYAHITGSTWERSLDEGQRDGLEGGDLLMYAGTNAALEGLLTVGMGMMGSRLGVSSLEEALSPAARHAVSKQIPKGAIQKLATELGGVTSEGVEGLLTAIGQQVNEIASGLRESVTWDDVLDEGASGVLGRSAVGAVKAFKAHVAKAEAAMPEIASGTRAAEIDIERGVNPLEVLDYLGNADEFHRQTGRKETTKQFRDSYRDALNFYIDEARAAGGSGSLAKMEQDVARLREEERQRAERVKQSKAKAKNKGKAGESQVSMEPVAEQPLRTADERAVFSLADFEARVQAPLVGTTVEPAPANVNPYVLAPWESETRPQRRIRLLSRDVAGYKEKVKELRAGAVQAKRLREDQLTDARKLVQENVPREDQWKFLRRVQAAKTPAKIDALLADVEKAIDRRDHNLAVIGLKQAFRKTSNLRKEFADVVKGIKGGIDLAAIKNRDAAESIRRWAAENPQAVLTDKDRETITRLEAKQNVRDMEAHDIRDLAEYVERLAYQSAVKDRILGNQQSAHVRDVGDEIARESVRSPKLAMDAAGERAVSSFTLLEAAERPEATLLRISPTLADHTYNKLAIEDQNTYDLARKQLTEETSAVLGDVAELEPWRNHKRLVAGVELNRGEALMVYRWLADPQARRSVLEAGVKLDGGKRILPPMKDHLNALADFVGEKGDDISQYMFATDNGWLIDGANGTTETLTGRVLSDKRDVVPIVRAEDDFAKFLTSGRTAAGYQEALLDSHGTFKRRTGAVSMLEIPPGMDAIDMFMSHADRLLRYSAFGVNARNAEMLLNDPAVKQAILSRNGQLGYDHIKDAVRSHVIGNNPRGKAGRMIAAFNTAVATGKIALSPSVMLQQLLDPLTAAPWDEGGTADLAAGYAELNSRGLAAVEEEMEQVLGRHSGNFWRRYKSGDYVGEHTSGQFKTQSYFRPSSLAQKVMHPMTRAEYFASAMPNYMAAKAAARRRFGLPEDDYSSHADNPEWTKSVVTAWDKKTYRGSNSSHGLELSGILRYAKDNPAAATVLNFFNTASKVYSLWTMGVSRAQQGHYKESGAFLSSALVNGAMVAIIQQAMTLSAADEEEPFWKKALTRFASNTVGLHPGMDNVIGQNVVEPTMRAVLDMKAQGPRFDNPVLVVETAGKMAYHATQAVNEFTQIFTDAYDPDAASREFIEGAARFLELRGLPAGQVKDLYRRAWRELEAVSVLPDSKLEKDKG